MVGFLCADNAPDTSGSVTAHHDASLIDSLTTARF